MGLDGEQLSNIFSMIGGPEQSNVEWWKGGDKKPVYGYCENIGDNRGVTVGLAGFVSNNGEIQKMIKSAGGPDFPRYGVDERKMCDWVKSNADNQRFIDAQWSGYEPYMKMVQKYIPSQFKDNALIKGIMLDTAMNAGEFKEGNAWGVKEVAQAARGNDAASWANSFLDFRNDHFTSGNDSGMRNGRIGAWRKLVKAGEWEMRVDPCDWAWCSGKCLGCR